MTGNQAKERERDRERIHEYINVCNRIIVMMIDWKYLFVPICVLCHTKSFKSNLNE